MTFYKIVSMTVLAVLCSFPTLACDMCGCYLGINPYYNQNTIGIRYRYRSFSEDIASNNHSAARLLHGGEELVGATGQMTEVYQTTELWARLYPTAKWQVNISLPFSHNYVQTSLGKDEVKGVGDALTTAQYQLLNTMPSEETTVRHRLLAGGGVKLPTGSFTKLNNNGSLDQHLQAGTGSFDFLGIATYLVKWRKLGLSNDFVYKYNTTNTNDFLFADRFNISSNVFYEWTYNNWTLLPNTGIYFENAAEDRSSKQIIKNTGGNVCFANLGFDVYCYQMAIHTAYQVPVYNDLFGQQADNQPRLILGIQYSFK